VRVARVVDGVSGAAVEQTERAFGGRDRDGREVTIQEQNRQAQDVALVDSV
jgi:hypothetical protein